MGTEDIQIQDCGEVMGVEGERLVGIMSRTLSAGASSGLSELWRPGEEPRGLCFDPKDGDAAGLDERAGDERAGLEKVKVFNVSIETDGPVKTALAASTVLPSPAHQRDTQVLKFLLNG